MSKENPKPEHNPLLAWQTITLEDGSQVVIQERVLKILHNTEIVLLRAGWQTDHFIEAKYRGKEADLMEQVKRHLLLEMGSQIMKLAPIVQVDIPVVEGLVIEGTLHKVGKEKPKRYLTQIPVLTAKQPKKEGDPDVN